MNFLDKLLAASRQQNSLLCVGLDPEPERLPAVLRDLPVEQAIVRFCHAIIEATTPYACAFKPNSAFFEVLGPRGMYVFQEVIRAIPAHIPVIIDAKRGDLGNTARNYAATVFDIYGCDAVTVNPYLGYDSIAPFLAYRDKGVILLCRTSNPSARDFQDLRIHRDDGQEQPLYELVARRIQTWNEFGNCGLVVGATYPQELATFALSVQPCPFLFQVSVPRVATLKPLSEPVSMPMANERFLQFHAQSCMLAVAAILLTWPRLKQEYCATV
jgi:orotidine-5'-phosphate decarboxylase